MDRRPALPKTAVALLQTGQPSSEHERKVHEQLAKGISALLGLPFAGICRAGLAEPELYLIPDATLIGPQPHIRSEADLYGGVVSQPFMAGKAISHPLVDQGAAAPAGWTDEFMRLAGDAVLPGYSAFDTADALRAGELLLQNGPLRAKQVQGRAGRGQQVIRDLQQLRRWLQSLEDEELQTCGVVLEQNLRNVQTYSIGQSHVGTQLISYFGQQRLTVAHDGASVYGGSDLHMVRGDYQLLQLRWLAMRVPALYWDAEWDIPKQRLNRERLMEYRQTRLGPQDNQALAACAEFAGDVLIVESEHDEHVPHTTIMNYRSSFLRAHSMTHRIIDGADHGLSAERCQQAYTSILTSWISEMIIGDRIGHLL